MTSMISKALFSAHPIFDRLLNPAYNSHQSMDDFWKYGSKQNFSTDRHINGEYFRSRTNNEYFCVLDKDTKIGELSHFLADFRPLHKALETRSYDPDKNIIVRLEFTKNKAYFVESYQAISIKNPDVTVMNIPLEELLLITPKFEELSQ